MKVSVIIPVYNVERYLERCVQSVQRQTYQDVEIILVDDGSPDNSGLLCDQLAEKDPRIRVIHQENQGLSGARNTGIRRATGDYIIFFDSDDEWLLDDGVEKVVKACDATTDLVIFKLVDIWSNGTRTLTPDYDIAALSRMPDASAVFSYLIQTQRFRAGVVQLMVRRSILVDHKVFFPSGLISEDVYWDMHLWQYVKAVKFVNINFYGYYHRAASLSTTPSIRVDRSYDKIFTDWKEQCQKGCMNAKAIRTYMANLWVSRGYSFYKLSKADKPEALSILKKHADLLDYADTPKAKRVRILVRTIGVRPTTVLLGIYWRLRSSMN